MLASCGEEAGGGDAAEDAKASWCAAGCATADLWGVGSGLGCEEVCRQRPEGLFLRMTPAAVTAQADCLARATSCSDGLTALFEACAAEAWSGFEATDASRATCEIMAGPFFDCHWFSSFEECASVHAVFQQPALEAWQGCVDSGCDGLQACMEATLYNYGE